MSQGHSYGPVAMLRLEDIDMSDLIKIVGLALGAGVAWHLGGFIGFMLYMIFLGVC